jgi:arylformamidase
MSDLEREYSPSSRVGGSSAPFIADYQARSAQAAATLGDQVQTLPGGTVLVVGQPSAPLLVFVHGGYWQALSAADSLYLAPGALRNGWSFAAIEYTIAPTGTIEQMVGQCRHALAQLGDVGAREVVLAGHSAGAHLAAMVSLAAHSPLRLARVALVSGVFDLRPLLLTTVNEPLALTPERAAASSPVLLPVVGGSALPVVVACGDNETAAFKDQSRRYAEHLRIGGMSVSSIECAPRHHFDVVDDLVDPLTELGRFTLGVR